MGVFGASGGTRFWGKPMFTNQNGDTCYNLMGQMEYMESTLDNFVGSCMFVFVEFYSEMVQRHGIDIFGVGVSTTNQTLNDVDCYDYWEVGVGSIKQ